jgi:hypothetical protein
MAQQRYFPPGAPAKGKTITELTVDEVLSLAGGAGPGLIGQELFARAEELRRTTSDGKYGPALIDPDYGLDITPWDDYSRKELLVICREHELPVKSNATREELAKALARKKIRPDDADRGEVGGPPTGSEGAE